MARRKSPAAEQAYEIILNRILSFELLPGDAVSDHALALKLDMSRTPIREAMQRLEHESLIERDKTKWVVSSLTLKDIQEICQVREALESKAVELIFRKGGLSREQIGQLREINRQMGAYVEDKNYEQNFASDDAFHAAILNFSENGRLIQLFSELRLQILRARWLTVYRGAEAHHQALNEHEAIIDGLQSGELARTRECVETHMLASEENFGRIFESENDDMPLKSMHLLGFGDARK